MLILLVHVFHKYVKLFVSHCTRLNPVVNEAISCHCYSVVRLRITILKMLNDSSGYFL